MAFALEAAEAEEDGIRGFLFEVFDVGGELVILPNEQLAHRYVPLEVRHLPEELAPGAGDGHRFADAFFVVRPGTYLVRVTPMVAENEQSELCRPDEELVTIRPSRTTEVILISHCDRPDNGGLDIIAVTNHDPEITDLVFDPSKFISTCEDLTLLVVADDPDGDDLIYRWEVERAPRGAIYFLEPQRDVVHFMSRTPGDYELRVTVCDSLQPPDQMCAWLIFPVHIPEDEEWFHDRNRNGIGDECDLMERIWTTPADFDLGQGENVFYDTSLDNGRILLDEFAVERTPYLWVPSSAANQVVLFNTETLQLINGSPFPACLDPSRLGQDSDHNVYVTCRGDGVALKLNLQGQVQWRADLWQACGGPLRGAAYVPRVGELNRVYIGCSTGGWPGNFGAARVLVLDADTGRVLTTIENTRWVYGLATDGERIYISTVYVGVQAIDIATHRIIWTTNEVHPYGIVARAGIVWVAGWLTGNRNCLLDGRTGRLLACVHVSSDQNRGIAIGPDGMVWAAQSDTNKVARINPATLHVDEFPTGGIESIGVEVDANNIVYVAHRGSSNITRLDSQGRILGTFGEGSLVSPYVYSSDMSGLNVRYLETRGRWVSDEVELRMDRWSRAEGSTVREIAWDTIEGASTEVLVEAMLDRSGVWQPVNRGAGLDGTHRFIQFRVTLRSVEHLVSPALLELRLTWQPW